jgi:hypothetical protein
MNNRKVEQLAARLVHTQEVAGSSPAFATNTASIRLNVELLNYCPPKTSPAQ